MRLGDLTPFGNVPFQLLIRGAHVAFSLWDLAYTLRDYAIGAPRRPCVTILGDRGVGKTALCYSILRGASFRDIEPELAPWSSSLKKETASTFIDISQNWSPLKIREEIERRKSNVVLLAVPSRLDSEEQISSYIERWSKSIPSGVNPKWKGIRLLVETKIDEVSRGNSALMIEATKRFNLDGLNRTSAATQEGIDALRSAMSNAIPPVDKEIEEKIEEVGDVAKVVRLMAGCLCDLIAHDPLLLDQIEWRDLERVIATVLATIGFDVELTRPAKDGGKDIIARCVVKNAIELFYVEVKHWKNGNKPGISYVADFVEVNARNATDGGLLLSSSGFTRDVYSQSSEIWRCKVRLGDRTKITSLCKHYHRMNQGLWRPIKPLPELLFEETLE